MHHKHPSKHYLLTLTICHLAGALPCRASLIGQHHEFERTDKTKLIIISHLNIINYPLAMALLFASKDASCMASNWLGGVEKGERVVGLCLLRSTRTPWQGLRLVFIARPVPPSILRLLVGSWTASTCMWCTPWSKFRELLVSLPYWLVNGERASALPLLVMASVG